MSEANESGTVSEANESGTVSEANESGNVSEETPEPQKPALRVVKGDPTPEELAALVAVLAARSAAAADAAARTRKPVRSEWGHPARAVRGVHRPGADQWRRSSWG
ncbi:acyl-CoA carboxylase subunit epsilon [Aeromicrobium sp. Leaf350]|uniref:acyl-CoA carboxylase subunit epsilon n=1 Tax=Aeromicrobium sp. Leaf350 TaxID=2876565 RepID=UPI001E3A215E|nr:acyl-CoA carboxylase subunit epsilon [Aeromicrobium sp. Leaf350]